MARASLRIDWTSLGGLSLGWAAVLRGASGRGCVALAEDDCFCCDDDDDDDDGDDDEGGMCLGTGEADGEPDGDVDGDEDD